MINSNGEYKFAFPSIHLSKERLIEWGKKFSSIRRFGNEEAKPEACALCGATNLPYCNSHSIPQFCLKRIAYQGKVKTINAAIDIDFFKDEVGVSRAGTFKMICRKCDKEYFADYENPDRLSKNTGLDNDLLGKIAVKVLLLEQYKAISQVAMLSAVERDHAFLAEPFLSVVSDVRVQDHVDNDIQLRYARCAADGGAAEYKTLLDLKLDYTVPLAFQGQIGLISGFDGRLINDTLNMSPEYHIEPLFVCIFPLPSGSRIFLFCRNQGYSRYSRFHRALKTLSQSSALQAVLKIVLAYSEEVYLSPLLPESVYSDKGFSGLARTSGIQSHERSAPNSRHSRKRMYAAYAIDKLQDPPRLLSAAYSMEKIGVS